MRNVLLGFLLGLMLATAAGLWAQTSGSVFCYGDSGACTFQNGDGTSGSLYTAPGTGTTLYRDSTGRSGAIFNWEGTGSSSYSFSDPCRR